MTLDEAISHAMDKYRECKTTNAQCSIDHYQLASWLSELKDVKNETSRLRKMLRTYTILIPILVAVQTSAIVVLAVKILKLKGLI